MYYCVISYLILGDLAVELISNPFKFKDDIREVVHCLLCTVLETEDLQLNQIITTIIPTSIPIENEIHMKALRSFQAVLIEHSEKQKYMYVNKMT